MDTQSDNYFSDNYFAERFAVMNRLFKGFCLAAGIGMAAWAFLVWAYTRVFKED